jgi:hypothetical protein
LQKVALDFVVFVCECVSESGLLDNRAESD